MKALLPWHHALSFLGAVSSVWLTFLFLMAFWTSLSASETKNENNI